MAVLSKNGETQTFQVDADRDEYLEEMLNKEWLLTNSRGGFACGTAVGCNTRRYHGLLVGSLNPPVKRVMALSACLETIETADGDQINLSCCEFEGASAQVQDVCLPNRFNKDVGVHFDYRIGSSRITKSIYLATESDVAAVVYDFSEVEEAFEFKLRPFAALRDFHSLQNSENEIAAEWVENGLVVKCQSGQAELFLQSDDMSFQKDPQWWYNFSYRKEKQRGQDFIEDLWSPGLFRRTIDGPDRIVLWAAVSEKDAAKHVAELDVDIICDDLRLRQNELLAKVKGADKVVSSLTLAASQFVVDKRIGDQKAVSILAGFPWFADWGRDAFISLPGLLLCTERFDSARAVLESFALAVDEGMIPNYFDDNTATASYNSIDSSLWFINAAFEYYEKTNDIKTFAAKLLPVIRWIIDSYHNGTKFGICGDTDMLITGGDEQSQLTWMDAKSSGVAFTPRYGKAVEINALWYSAICRLAKFYDQRDVRVARHFDSIAKTIAESFCAGFWNEELGYLNDCILPDGLADVSLRPNQIFAVSLAYSPLSFDQQRSVVAAVEAELLTPYGLRTLSSKDERYAGKYIGNQDCRDAAYHQGTVWPWLMGPFIEAYLRVNNFSGQSKKQCSVFLKPLLKHARKSGCIGSISEIFDGDEPHDCRGAFAQAWSVAEVLRAYMLIND